MQLAGGPAATQISDQRDGVNQTTLLHAEHILLVDELGFRLRLVRENAQLATAAS
jgi:hypothetical protein